MNVRALVAWLCLLALPVSAAELRGSARGWLGPGVDTNAQRDFVSAGNRTAVDGFLFALVQLDGAVDFERARLVGSYDVAARKFLQLGAEDTLVQNAQLDGTYAIGRAFNVGLVGRARDRRGAGRDYTDLVGHAVVDFLPDAKVDVRLLAGVHRFWYWPRTTYSHFGPDGSLQARYRFDRRHSASLLLGLNLRTYDALTNPDPKDPEPPAQVTRFDSVMQVGVSYSYRGPFHVTAGYTYSDQTSNSFGETIRRHRFSVTAGVKLPFELTVLATGALQFSNFPDQVYLSPELQVADDEENSSTVTVKLVRPLTKYLDLDLRYALYWNRLPQSDYLYLRQVISAGVSVSF